MRNFSFPYFSRDIAEFWRRWHISLTTWFRDYLYIPLGGSRCGRRMRIRNTFAIFLVSGLWHGANWTFVLWGALHALLFLPLLLAEKNRRHLALIAEDRALPSVVEFGLMVRTFAFVMIGWLVFRARSICELGRWIFDIFNLSSYGRIDGFPNEGNVAIVSIGILLICEWVNRREQFGFARMPRSSVARWSVYLIVVFLIFLYAPGSHSFIYFQF